MRLSLWILLLCLLLVTRDQASAEEVATEEASSRNSADMEEEEEEEVSPSDTVNSEVLDVIDLDSRSFSKSVWDGNVWLIEFMAPWCGHCTNFSPSYQQVARHFHGSSQKVKVAKVNGESERALTSRFGVSAYPSFYVVDGLNVYPFEKARSQKNLIEFVEEGYKKTSPMPFYSSPMGPIGLAQGLLMTSGIAAADLFYWLQDLLGVSPLIAGAIMFGSGFMGCFFTIVFLAIVITPKSKVD